MLSLYGFLAVFLSALRGAATLKQRVQRETRSNASVLPYEKGSEKGQSWSTDIWCKEGELLKRTRKGKNHWDRQLPKEKKTLKHGRKTKGQSFVLDAGDLHRTRVSIYINKRPEVRRFSFSSASQTRKMQNVTDNVRTVYNNR